MMMPVKHPFSAFGNVHFECLAKNPGGADQHFEILSLKMCLHGWACLPLSNHAKGIFLFESNNAKESMIITSPGSLNVGGFSKQLLQRACHLVRH
jgi:hypothetical protein